MQATTQALQTWHQAYSRSADARWLGPIREAEARLQAQARRLTDEPAAQGPVRVSWDGRPSQGAAASAGRYVATVSYVDAGCRASSTRRARAARPLALPNRDRLRSRPQ